MPRRESVVPKEMLIIRDRFGYSPAVEAGPLLLIAGQTARAENLIVVEGKEAQVVQAFENGKTVLTAAGLTFDDVVEMVTYHTALGDVQLIMDVKDRYFTNQDQLPTWTALGVTALA